MPQHTGAKRRPSHTTTFTAPSGFDVTDTRQRRYMRVYLSTVSDALARMLTMLHVNEIHLRLLSQTLLLDC
eukprot:COSAG01_NODE_4548_length_4932_cov_3.672460_2_plen_71_part_00